MKVPEFLQFIIQPATEGGYFATAVGHSIYTQGETVDETICNIREAVDCHFFDDSENRTSHHVPILANVYVSEVTTR
jgi:predicted RNase H-like HicB family nuclease